MHSYRPGALALFIAVSAVACDAPPADGVDAGSPAAGADAAGADPAEAPIQLAPIDRSGVTGTAMLDRGDEVTLTLLVEGLEPGSRYSAHVHDGRCAAGGPVRVPLQDLTVSEEGTARLVTRVGAGDIPPDEPVFVQVHAPSGRPVACADLNRRAEESSLMLEPDSAGAR